MDDLCCVQNKLRSLQQQIFDLTAIINNYKAVSFREDFIAGETISGGKAVWIETDKRIYLVDITNAYHYTRYIGIAETGANAGTKCTVLIEGVTTIMGSGWVPGYPYYIGTNSYLTIIPPTSGLLKLVGVGIDTNTILINNQFDVLLA